MSTVNRLIRNALKQLLILIGLIGITFTAGINWAEAAGTLF